jgi:hypothetical protein
MDSSPTSTNWTWGARPDPLWNPNLEGFEGRVTTHESWHDCWAALTYDNRRVHDFYFQVTEEQNVCAACDGTECVRDYAEFLEGFHADGGGRWAGWGYGPLPTAELDLLRETFALHHQTLPSSFGLTTGDERTLTCEQEALVKETIGPMRAAALDIASLCGRCTDGARSWDELLVWSFGDMPGTGRIDVVRLVVEEDHELIRAYMRDSFTKIEHRLISAAGRGGWDVDFGGIDDDTGAWFMRNERVSTFDKFLQGIGAADARNLLFDVHVVPTFPGHCMLRFWMTHPARGYGREILVEKASEEDADALARILSDHYEVHRRNFGWALTAGDTNGRDDDGREVLAELMKRGA